MFISPATDSLPGEPLRQRVSTPWFLLRIMALGLLLAVGAALTIGFWPPFVMGLLVWGWPPHQAGPPELRRFLRRTWTERPPAPGIAPLSRIWLTLRMIQRIVILPAAGTAWFLDELLFSRKLDATPVEAPLILMSAQRSGSTQLARYLEDDPRLAATSAMQCLLPYLWLWKIVPGGAAAALGERVMRAIAHWIFPVEMQQRHELDPFRSDTLEVLFYVHRLNLSAVMLGPQSMADEFMFAGAAPHNRGMWQQDFVDWLDRLGRKTLIAAGVDDSGQPRRLFVKGHFIEAADALASRYPSAHFLSVVREPASRLRSALNHQHGNAFDEFLGAVPWAWLTACVPAAEAEYCRREQAWYSRPDGPNRTVVLFEDYRTDLPGTMLRIHRSCFADEELPPGAPTTHTPRERNNYLVNRSLEQLGIDQGAYLDQLTDYLAWIDSAGVGSDLG